MKLKNLIIILIILIGFTSCDDLQIEIIGFSESQPNDVKNLKKFPRRFVGYYTDEVGNEIKITKKSIIEYSKGGTIDKYYSLSDSLIIKKVGSSYLFNFQITDSVWFCQLLRFEKNVLNFYSVEDSNLRISKSQIKNLSFDKDKWKMIVDNGQHELENKWTKNNFK